MATLEQVIEAGIIERRGSHYYHEGLRVKGGKAAAEELAGTLDIDAPEPDAPEPEVDTTPDAPEPEPKADEDNAAVTMSAPEVAPDDPDAVTVRVVGRIHAPSFVYIHQGVGFTLSEKGDTVVPKSHLKTIGRALEGVGLSVSDTIRVIKKGSN